MIEDLIIKYLSHSLNNNEQQELDEWLKVDENASTFKRITDSRNLIETLSKYEQFDVKRAYNELQKRNRRRHLSIWKPLMKYAAAILLVLGATFILLEKKELSSPKKTRNTTSDAIQLILDEHPLLTLSGNEIQDYLLPNTDSVKYNNKRIKFLPVKTPTQLTNKTTTIITPSCKQYEVELVDGSIVKLNANSELRFSERFSKYNRVVYAKGELYFSVSPDSIHPFTVLLDNGTKIEVVGTEFNVKCHSNHSPAITSLVKGKVNVMNRNYQITLSPGESTVSSENRALVKTTFDKTSTLAWCNNRFNYTNTRLESVLDDIAFYYNLNVFYSNDHIRNQRFTIDLPQSIPLDSLLEILEGTNTVHFKREKNTLIIQGE